jgi:hypothetical protein
VYAPIEGVDDEHGILDATRHAHVQQFSDPVAFAFRVPRKNQPKVHKDDDIASEYYVALWNGAILMVGWKQPQGTDVSASGGHVVEEILETATERIDAGVIVQACNPQCKFVFVHTALRAVADPDAAGWTFAYDAAADPYLMEVVVPEAPSEDGDLLEVELAIWWRTIRSVRSFARMKNLGRQILELEHLVRWDLDRLNRLHHERASASQGDWKARIRVQWKFRKWRRTSRLYLARLWLGLGSLERLKREWSDARLDFDQAATEQGIEALFAIDAHGEVALVERLHLGLVEAAVEHAGDRLGASTLAVATAAGAIAGAVGAAIIGAVS